MKFYLTFIIFILTLHSFSQDLNFGIKFGGNYCNLYNNKVDVTIYQDFNYKYGYEVGCIVKIRHKNLGLHFEPGISNRGSRVNDKFDYNLNYISTPILLTLNPTKKISFLIGPEISFLYTANKMDKWDLNSKVNTENLFNNKTDIALSVGISLLIGKHWGIEGRVSYGLISPTEKLSVYDAQGVHQQYIETNNQCIIVNVFYLFRKFKRFNLFNR